MTLKLPDGWKWSYCFDRMKEYDGSMVEPCACAIKTTKICNENGDVLYLEVYQNGSTLKEAKENVVNYIKNNKEFKSRYIHFMDDD